MSEVYWLLNYYYYYIVLREVYCDLMPVHAVHCIAGTTVLRSEQESALKTTLCASVWALKTQLTSLLTSCLPLITYELGV